MKMTKSPKNNGRKTDGTFAPGNNLGGKTVGARNKTTVAVEGLLDGQAEQLTQKAVSAALEGDMTAMRLCLERICPPRKGRLVTFPMPEMNNSIDAVTAMAQILENVASGEITPEEASRISSIVETYRRTLETSEFETRITALENRGQQ